MIRVKKILYPTDFSSYSTHAYFHAVGLAEVFGAELTLLFVYSPAADDPPRGPDFWREKLLQIRPANHAIRVSHIFLEGDPATEIVKHAAAAGSDAIILGTHGRSGVDRLLMGSVAERVMRDAPCSVTVVKLPRARLTEPVFAGA